MNVLNEGERAFRKNASLRSAITKLWQLMVSEHIFHVHQIDIKSLKL